MSNKKQETRSIGLEIRAKEDSRRVEGYALLFDTPSDRMPYVEVIDRSAMDGVIVKSDVFAYLDHGEFRGVLARNSNGKGSLNLELDDKGLKYSFEAPNTDLGNVLLEHLRRGEITESSFAFTVEEDEVLRNADGSIKRTIKKFDRLYDVSPVFRAAYSSTNVYARSVEEMQKELDELEARKKKEEKGEEIPESYYTEIENSFK